MQVDVPVFLDLVENKKSIFFFDTESQGLEGDYGRLYVGSIKPYKSKTITFNIGANASDKGLAKDLKDVLEQADAWVTYYGKGHDIPLLNTRLTRWGYEPVAPRLHIDMFYTLKYKLKTARKSQAHMLEFLQDTMKLMGIKQEQKMTISPNVWSDLWQNFDENIAILRDRCASDVEGLEALYRVTRHLIRDIKR